MSPVCYRVVNVDGDIAYRQNRYSVPWRHTGRSLPVRVTETEVIIYDPLVQEIARHLVFPRSVNGQCRRQQGASSGGRHHTAPGPIAERFAELGEIAARFLDALQRTTAHGKDQAQRVLALLATYAPRGRAGGSGTGRALWRLLATKPWNASWRCKLSPKALWKL